MAERIVVPDLWTGRCQCGDHAYEASGFRTTPTCASLMIEQVQASGEAQVARVACGVGAGSGVEGGPAD